MSVDDLVTGICACLIATLGSVPAAPAQEAGLAEITVVDSARQRERFDLNQPTANFRAPDAVALLAAAPGADFNNNGPISGQSQYRGLFGPRMNVRVDEMTIASGGPNWMDPPLHYLPAGLMEELVLTRGIAPVGTGSGIGGYVSGRTKSAAFSDGVDIQLTGDVTATVRSNDGSALTALIGASNHRHRFHVLGAREEGDDVEFGNGRIAATRHERDTYGLAYGFRTAEQGELSFQYYHTDTGDSGNPSLPLDITFFDADRLSLRLRRSIGDGARLKVGVHGTDIAHRMSNFRLRPPPDLSSLPLPPFVGDDRRFVDTRADGLGFDAAVTFGRAHRLTIGVDGNFAEHEARVFDPDVPSFFVTNFNNSRRDDLGLFLEWSDVAVDGWGLEGGVRLERVEMDSGPVDAQPAQLVDAGLFGPGTPPFAVSVLRNRFNAADRGRADNNLDWTLEASRAFNERLSFGVGVARKSRSPSYIERYLWAPLEVNAGLGDGNNYVGRIDLDPEVSHQLELSVDWRLGALSVQPRVFYRTVNDYIQGVADSDMLTTIVSGNANGDPTPLVFANVDAELYGFDLGFDAAAGRYWELYGSASWVRGKRRDVDDNLYRIAPPNLRFGAHYIGGGFRAGAEAVIYGRGDDLSKTIVLDEIRTSNAETPGHGIINVYGQWRHPSGWELSVGIDNLLDRSYVNHLAGFNRVMGSDVALWDRLPGTGRNLYASVAYRR